MLNRKSIAKAQQNIEREELLGDVRMNDLDLTSQDHQQRYADSTARLDSQSAIIQDSQRMTEDTIAITTEALVELDRQRGVIERSHERVCIHFHFLNILSRISFFVLYSLVESMLHWIVQASL